MADEKGEPVGKVVPIALIGWIMMTLGWLVNDGVGTALFRGGILLIIAGAARWARNFIESP